MSFLQLGTSILNESKTKPEKNTDMKTICWILLSPINISEITHDIQREEEEETTQL